MSGDQHDLSRSVVSNILLIFQKFYQDIILIYAGVYVFYLLTKKKLSTFCVNNPPVFESDAKKKKFDFISIDDNDE